MTLPAITIRNPWAWVIAETAALTALGMAPKAVENRGRPIAARHIGADIAIHAGLTTDRDALGDSRVRDAWAAFAAGIGCCRKTPHPALAAIGDLRSGCVGHRSAPEPDGGWIRSGEVVAVARLVNCHPALDAAATCCQPWGERRHNGRPAWHLVLGDVRRLRKPVSARGALSVPWTLPPDVEAQVRAQLAEQVPS